MTSYGASPSISSYPNSIDRNTAGVTPAHPRPLNYGYGSASVPVQYTPRGGSTAAATASTSVSSNGSTLMSSPVGRPINGQMGPSGVRVAHYPTASRVPVNVQPRQHTSAAPSKGTLKRSQEVVVGAQKVVVDRYLSEGELEHRLRWQTLAHTNVSFTCPSQAVTPTYT